MNELSFQDMKDILLGCTVLGTGGGGEMSEGLALINEVIEKGLPLRLVGLDEAPDDEWICTPYLLGALDLTAKEADEYKALPRNAEPAICAAYSRIESYFDRKFYGTVCCEMGGSNTAVAFYTAALNGGVVIDGDPAGRAVPEITHSTYYLNGLDAAPVIAANSFCETFVCEGLHDDQRAEHVMRALCQVSANDIAAIDHAMPVKDIRHALIGGTISKAWALGKAVSAAKEEGADIAKVIADVGNGFVAFRGKVTAFEFDTIGGFSVGTVDLAGADDDEGNDAGHTYKLGVKNENLISYYDGEVDVTIPDLICVIDENTGEPVTNPHYEIGQSLAVIILPAPDAFLTPKGLATFGPAYVGVDAPYRPASLQNRHNK
jgi:DUF917 family protein